MAVFFDLWGDLECCLCDRFSGLTILLLTVQSLCKGAGSSILDSDSVEEELQGPRYAFALAVAALEKYALGWVVTLWVAMILSAFFRNSFLSMAV